MKDSKHTLIFALLTVGLGIACGETKSSFDAGIILDAGSSIDDNNDDRDTGIIDSGVPAATLETPAFLAITEGHESDIGFGWIGAGQPSEGRVIVLMNQGARIISLRTPAEDPFDEEATVASFNGTFIRYPTTSSDYDSTAFREAMYDLYDEQRALGGAVYLHCASSNRVGASWALYLAERLGLDADDALARGRAAGLASLEGRVRGILGL